MKKVWISKSRKAPTSLLCLKHLFQKIWMLEIYRTLWAQVLSKITTWQCLLIKQLKRRSVKWTQLHPFMLIISPFSRIPRIWASGRPIPSNKWLQLTINGAVKSPKLCPRLQPWDRKSLLSRVQSHRNQHWGKHRKICLTVCLALKYKVNNCQ